ncbi:MAG: hypothetical protein AAGF87_13100 [Bacteroidota bacterium]
MHTQLLHIILSCCLFVGQSGIPVWAHYCQGDARGMSLFAQAESCHSSSEKEPSGCCSANHELPQDQDEDQDDCCSSEFSFFRLAQVEYSQAEQELVEICWPCDRPAEVQIKTHVPFSREMASLQLHVDDKPPPLHGRLMRISLASFLC